MRKGIGAAALGISALSLIQPCSAQSEQELEKVVVTATRFPEEEGNTIQPRRVVISREEIERSGAQSVGDLLKVLGGVYAPVSLNGNRNTPFDIRGFGENSDRNTLVLVDGVRISENELSSAYTGSISPSSIERIEILRGGAGAVLYGEGATGGTINIITRSPGADGIHGGAALGHGDFDTSEYSAYLSAAAGPLSIRVEGASMDSYNYRQHNHDETSSGGITTRLAFERGEIRLRASTERERVELPGALSLAQFYDDPRQANPGSLTDGSFSTVDRQGAFASYRISELEFSADLARTDRHSDFVQFGFPSTYSAHTQEFSPRVRWSHDFGAIRNILIAGLDWTWWQSDRPSQTHADQDSEAAYLQEQIEFPSGTKLVVGGRHERFRKHTDFAFAPADDGTQSVNAWQTMLSQPIGGAWTASASFGQSYRIPNVDDNAARISTQLLNPQRSHDAELGLAWKRETAQLAINLFQHRVHDEIAFDSAATTCFGGGFCGFGANRNLSPTRRTGIELDGRLQLTSWASVSARYTYIRARFVDGDLNGQSVAGRELTLVPKQRFSLRANFVPWDGGSLQMGMLAVTRQRFSGDYANDCPREIPGFSIFDARIAHRIGAAELSLSAGNLTNRKYFDTGFCSFGAVSVYPQAGRQVMARIKIDL